ncbi:sugar phosphate isomerase/epimerase family protein [Hymenobacter sp. YC55]|uniref:sugar phosphate isomerase/epimerase family protein n=1 Tax=Hymenobacter sp. YC55 TaxID=3034019 RepID=UPI0023F71A0B|nr:sugar phosphate isomerase/epimerase family protein [Hymenobacter sp. YC55]MDF7814083.1 sugar phosphate isomerase/epimerase [Hymenobacter sp. YC55]
MPDLPLTPLAPHRLRYAYNTNGAANHRLTDALTLIAEAGYDGVALTLDHHHHDPFAPDFTGRNAQLARQLQELGLGLVVETGARYLLDPRQKHEPTLLTPSAPGRARRVEFLTRCLDVCAACQGETVSFWAGVPQPGVTAEQAWDWLLEGVHQVAAAARERGVIASLEPEPGMLIETVDDYRRVQAVVPDLRLALDTGHLLVTGERNPAAAVREFAPLLGTVALEDMRRGVHEHLPFGEGDMDVPAVLQALHTIRFAGLVCVELSRESPRAHQMIPQALAYLRQAEHQLQPA